MKSALITGGSGFFGGILKRRLLSEGWTVTNIDLVPDDDRHPQLTSIRGDIRDRELVDRVLRTAAPSVIFHCAAILAHAVKDKRFLWTSNVDGTRVVADAALNAGVRNLIFISSNCLWGQGFKRPVLETDAPSPVEIYGRSKWEGEKILGEYTDALHIVIFRSPTIVDAGRLGLLAILFEFIDEGRKVWVVGGGKNRYQFIYAQDLATACIQAATFGRSATFNIGSDDVPTFREAYEAVIAKVGSQSRVARLPRSLTLLGMRLLYALGLSPLGPYQYKMIAEDFTFDTSRIKQELGWEPTLRNQDMLLKAYEYYRDHRRVLKTGASVSAHKQPAKMGVIRLLKWMS
jgi:nucleoside-diphosphate-sugar epimerase